MYQVKGLFSVRTELFKENEHFFKGLEYQAQASDDGFTRVIVTDSPEYALVILSNMWQAFLASQWPESHIDIPCSPINLF